MSGDRLDDQLERMLNQRSRQQMQQQPQHQQQPRQASLDLQSMLMGSASSGLQMSLDQMAGRASMQEQQQQFGTSVSSSQEDLQQFIQMQTQQQQQQYPQVAAQPSRGVQPRQQLLPLNSPIREYLFNFLCKMSPENTNLFIELFNALTRKMVSNEIFQARLMELVGNEAYAKLSAHMKQVQRQILQKQQMQQQQQQQQAASFNDMQTSAGSVNLRRLPKAEPANAPPQAPTPQEPVAQPKVQKDSSVQNLPANEAAIDPSNLQDVIKFAGVDLTAESEMMMRDLEHSHGKAGNYGESSESEMEEYDEEGPSQTFVDPIGPLQTRVRRIAKVCGLKNVASDIDAFLSMALKQRLKVLLQQSIRASKYRVEVARERWDIELVDGESAISGTKTELEGRRSRIGAVKRPLVWLERFEKNKEIKLALNTLKGSVSDEGRNAILEAGVEEEAQVTKLDEPEAEEEEKDTKKKKGKEKDYWKERDDQAIRARQTNVTALQAVGIDPKYSWMMTGTLNTNDINAADKNASNDLLADSGNKGDANKSAKDAKESSTLTGFGLPRPEIRKKTLDNRRVQTSDLMFALSLDKSREGSWQKLRKSGVLIRAYASLQKSNE